jgi:hypothetical protein
MVLYSKKSNPEPGKKRLVPDFDSNMLFDLAGNLVLEESRHFQIPFRAYVTLR